MADYDDYPGVPADRYDGFWDPDEAPPGGGPYAAFPRYPGLLERAQAPFAAEGLKVPWYISRGNHDGLIQGNAPASTDLFRAIAAGCLKVFPSAAVDPARFANAEREPRSSRRSPIPAFIQTLLAGARKVPPDPDRRIISTVEYKREIGNSHGYGHVAAAERRASDGVAAYYSFRPRAGIELVSLDTVAEGGGAERQPRRPAVQVARADAAQRPAGAPARDRLRPPHARPRWTTRAPTSRPARAAAAEAGLRRRPAPLHAAAPRAGRPRNVRDLFLKYPNVIAYVAGHTHANRVDLFRKGRSGLLADQHRVAHRLAAAEPADRADGQPRRHAVAVRDDPRPRRPDPRARRRHDRRRVPPRAS